MAGLYIEKAADGTVRVKYRPSMAERLHRQAMQRAALEWCDSDGNLKVNMLEWLRENHPSFMDIKKILTIKKEVKQ